MFTNTYRPHVGGVAHAVAATTEELRRQGHEVLIVCPEFPGALDAERDVVRIPAIQRFNGSDFSVALPVSVRLRERLTEFAPDVIHSHHPFLLGDTAVRLAAELMRPLVFTHHTLYERYTHYVPADSPALRRFVAQLAVGYGALANRVIAPSESIAQLLRTRGLTAPIDVVPTGFAPGVTGGSRGAARQRWRIPSNAFVVGHVGRLAPEKNLEFLADAVGEFLVRHAEAYLLLVGDGPSKDAIHATMVSRGVTDQVRQTGTLTGRALADAYAGMDVFVFASTSETQGLVLIEAMANGVYAITLDASGTRDVVVRGVNGELLEREERERFVDELNRFTLRYAEESAALRQHVRRSVERYSIEHTTAALVESYRTATEKNGVPPSIDVGGWSALLRRFEAEWSLLSNVAGSMVGPAESPMVSDFGPKRPLAFPANLSQRRARGLILVQIDGLARSEFERALNHGRLPFLRELIVRSDYRTVSFYSGIPSTTPAVQGELFYGVKGCVPAFEYFDRARRELVRMFSAVAARRVEARLERNGEPMLRGGSSYSNIYCGGGDEARYCASTFSIDRIRHVDSPTETVGRALWYAASMCRLGGLLIVETVIAAGDFVRGIREGFPWRHEAFFVPTRILICILLRELITIGARIDVRRGIPIIHLNFLGYDEQAHRRGPDSAFAHWALKGIDRAIRRIVNTASKRQHLPYEVWVYADHGQERTIPYEIATGRTIGEAVSAVFGMPVRTPPRFLSETIELCRSGRRAGARLIAEPGSGEPSIIVSAMGPLGHLYLPTSLSTESLRQRCEALVDEAAIPLALARLDGRVWAFTAHARGPLREVERCALGIQHPFRRHVVDDLERLCLHPDAGDIVIVGWGPNDVPMSFVLEWGAHGGPGAEETHGFALLPRSRIDGRDVLRPLDLRACVGRFRTEAADSDEPHKTDIPSRVNQRGLAIREHHGVSSAVARWAATAGIVGSALLAYIVVWVGW